MKFPKKRTILENAKLDFVNIDNVLSASKKERASKISGYVLLKYPNSMDIILLREGEPINAGRFTRRKREIVPIEEVVKKAKNATSGLVSVYETASEVVRMLLSSISEKPIFKEKDVSEVDIVKLIKKLVELKYSGFFELRKGISFSYVSFEKGYAKKGFFNDKLGVPLSNEEFLKMLLKSSKSEGLKISAFKTTLAEEEQAPPSAITLFLNVINDLSKKISSIVGESLSKRTISMAFDKTRELFDWFGGFKIKGLVIEGTAAVSSEDLANGFAYLIKDLVEFYKPILGARIEKIVKDILKDYRFALKNLGFYKNYGMEKYEE
ncbi:MAG: hypothetical protein E3J87_00500 [Candidatus Cloacimonadota bacterium]|nr:MAG: hypothetical protein E3J87_00500 [Candidatus Cloacimonadota bacterium]